MGHAAFLAAFGLLIIELALTGFAKVPFTCSYLPGKANLKIMFGVYWGLLIIVSEVVTDVEQAGAEPDRRLRLADGDHAAGLAGGGLAWTWRARPHSRAQLRRAAGSGHIGAGTGPKTLNKDAAHGIYQ